MAAGTADHLVIGRLALIRRVYAHASRLSSSPTSHFSRVLAVTEYDWSAEALLFLAIQELDPGKSAEKAFPNLLDQCDVLLGARKGTAVPFRSEILRVHHMRNDVQHRGRIPSEPDVLEASVHTQDFLVSLSRLVWDIDIREIRLSSQITNAKARQFLADAETAFSEARFDDTAKWAATSLAYAMSRVKRFVVGPMPGFISGLATVANREVGVRDSREVLEALERTRNAVVFLALGMDATSYYRYRRLVPHVTFSADGSPHFTYWDQIAMSESDADWLLNYVADAINEIEARVGDLDLPYGLSRPPHGGG